MNSPSFGANMIIRCLQQEDAINWARAVQSRTNPTTLTVVCRDKPPQLCLNCKKEGHLATYCIKTGGGMGSKTVDKAHTAQCNPWRNSHNGDANPPQTSSAMANVATASGNLQETTMMING